MSTNWEKKLGIISIIPNDKKTSGIVDSLFTTNIFDKGVYLCNTSWTEPKKFKWRQKRRTNRRIVLYAYGGNF